jgi:uncharacterized protein YndB with AHSA1/START domain
MTTKNQTILSKDIDNKKINVVREFAALVEDVWNAWTDASLLDQWWAPKPWKAITKSMDFREGGFWLYYMSGPNGEQIWNRVDFITIDPQKSFMGESCFCDEDGKNNSSLPTMHWKNRFHKIQEGTKVEVEITFAEKSDLQKIIEMGFEAGFTAALENLDEVLEK